ncbi:hypothetical protein PVAP13_7KG338900 [Panicum virgatum]|uniref:Uncharacterized protein n=1 Tax=Panicum virgatum TaxID=38727 RepID=A0A8T0QMW9_PANVG|nr:hypothetical protein PVAP13_7KG338900 [Panicum virgatum]
MPLDSSSNKKSNPVISCSVWHCGGSSEGELFRQFWLTTTVNCADSASKIERKPFSAATSQ